MEIQKIKKLIVEKMIENNLMKKRGFVLVTIIEWLKEYNIEVFKIQEALDLLCKEGVIKEIRSNTYN